MARLLEVAPGQFKPRGACTARERKRALSLAAEKLELVQEWERLLERLPRWAAGELPALSRAAWRSEPMPATVSLPELQAEVQALREIAKAVAELEGAKS